MLIDWFTVGAQALNFIILVWLLKRFLYKPILNAIDAREKLIAAKLTDADTKEAEAKKERAAYQQKNETFDKQRAAMMGKATDDADAERHKLLDEARQAADALSAKRQKALRDDARGLDEAIRHRTQQEVFAIARQVLSDLAGVNLEERITDILIERIRTMDGKVKEVFASALKSAHDPALVRSAFDMPEKQRAAIQASLDEALGSKIEIRFETAPDLVSGIELSINGQKLAWSIADYLASLQKGVAALLSEQDKPTPKRASGPAVKPVAAPSAMAGAAARPTGEMGKVNVEAARA